MLRETHTTTHVPETTPGSGLADTTPLPQVRYRRTEQLIADFLYEKPATGVEIALSMAARYGINMSANSIRTHLYQIRLKSPQITGDILQSQNGDCTTYSMV